MVDFRNSLKKRGLTLKTKNLTTYMNDVYVVECKVLNLFCYLLWIFELI